MIYQGEPINQRLREHQSQTTPWLWGPLVKDLHRWADRFDRDFELRLPQPSIGVEPLRHEVLAYYQLGRNTFGLRTTIVFNARWLPLRPFSDTLCTLIHEQIHAWEEWHEGRQRGGRYHTVAWRKKMAELGIEADQRGLHEGERHFLAYLQQFDDMPNIADLVPESLIPRTPARRVQAKKQRGVPKWVCACPTSGRFKAGRPVRATHMNAVCLDCGTLYRLEE